MLKPAVFLDRDNTLIHGGGVVDGGESLVLMKGVGPAVASLKGLGYDVIVVANEPGVASGAVTEDGVRAAHVRLAEMVSASANGARIDGFYLCPFDPDAAMEAYQADHEDRKPRPGMLLGAAEDHGLDLSRSWMVGDEAADVLAGAAAGVRTVLVGEGAEALAGAMSGGGPDYVAETLAEAVRVIAHRGGVKGQGRGGVDVGGVVGGGGGGVIAHGGGVKGQGRGGVDEGEVGVEGCRRWDAAAVARVQKVAVVGSGVGGEGGGAGGGIPTEVGTPMGVERGRGFVPVGAAGGEAGPPIAEPAYRKVLRSVAAGVQERVSAWREGREEEDGEAGVDAAEPEPGVQEGRPAEAGRPVGRQGVRSDETDEGLLRAILAELRAQRRAGGGLGGGGRREFDGVMVFALVLQMVAVVCLLGGLLMGAGEVGLFVKWLGVGLMAQLASIGLVVFSRG